MRVLIYKRTHNGDPDVNGCFGVNDCMGIVRARDFDAVIGIGGVGPEAQANGISGQINWVGIGPHKTYVRGKREPEVTFDHFVYFGTDGPDFRVLAPVLAGRMYETNVRSVLRGLTAREREEMVGIVQSAADEPPSPAWRGAARSVNSAHRCSTIRPTTRPTCTGPSSAVSA